jgi:CheY-like chemotaxis protein
MVEADEGQIGQVIQNVVINAKEAIPEEGKITVIVRNVGQNEHPALGKGKHVGIIVHDNGTGITERDLPRIFDPYFSTKDSGSGLGLATSHSIINNHDGVIDVKSQLDKGSEFHIYLPAVKGVAEGATGDLQISHPEWRGRVLLMDDEELVRVVAEKMLNALGHEVELAEDGEAAVRKYREARDSGNPFDVTILDLTVRGGMGGEWTIKRLIELDPETIVIVSSGYSEESILSNFKFHGFKDCLTKPYDIDDLRIKLNALLA